jgi:sarcosine oxidase
MRQTAFWFQTNDSPNFDASRFPVFMADVPGGCFYGIPATDGRGLKVARHYAAPELQSPDEIRRTIDSREVSPIREFVKRHIPNGDRPVEHFSVCIYTLTPDRHFVIDRHPQHANVAIACGFSGHGFKFAPVVGELLADLIDDVHEHGPELFRIDRFA